jgi:hypothetical protein
MPGAIAMYLPAYGELFCHAGETARSFFVTLAMVR